MYDFSIETNVVAIMILITLFFSLKNHLSRQEYINKLFLLLLWLNMAVLAVDSLIIIFNGNATSLGFAIHPIGVIVYYFFQPLIPLVWLLYVDYFIFKDRKRFVKILWMTVPLIIIHTYILLFSPGGYYIFNIDVNNVYARGNIFFLSVGMSYGLVIASTIHVLNNRKKIKANEIMPLLLFAAPPSFAGVFQILFPGMTIIWPSMTVSMLIVYIYIQSKMTRTDYLTGLYNRREYENHLGHLEDNKLKNYVLGGIIIDMDNFKGINDAYGHHIGDAALIKMSEILKKCVRKDDFIARLGGDEFAVVVIAQDPNIIDEISQRIMSQVKVFNQSQPDSFQLSISMGSGIYHIDAFESIEHFFVHLDHKMYASKKNIQNK